MAKKYDWTDKVRVVKRLSVEQLRAAVDLIGGDGHTIFDPEAFVAKCGWQKEDIKPFITLYKSDLTDTKETIFTPDGVAKQLEGVYGLSMLKSCAGALNVEYEGALGRGFEARNITAALRKHWNSQKTRTEALEIV